MQEDITEENKKEREKGKKRVWLRERGGDRHKEGEKEKGREDGSVTGREGRREKEGESEERERE